MRSRSNAQDEDADAFTFVVSLFALEFDEQLLLQFGRLFDTLVFELDKINCLL